MKENLEEFLAEYKALCDRYGLSLQADVDWHSVEVVEDKDRFDSLDEWIEYEKERSTY